MQLATYKSMLTKASNDLAKSKQLVGLLKRISPLQRKVLTH